MELCFTNDLREYSNCQGYIYSSHFFPFPLKILKIPYLCELGTQIQALSSVLCLISFTMKLLKNVKVSELPFHSQDIKLSIKDYVQIMFGGCLSFVFGIRRSEPYTTAVYFKTFLNFTSFFYWIPYSIQWNEETMEYILREKSKFSKVLCLLIQIGVVVNECFNISNIIKTYTTKTKYEASILIFPLASSFSEICSVYLVCKLLCWRKQDTLRLINILKFCPVQKPPRFWRIQACLLSVLVISQNFISGTASPHQIKVIQLSSSFLVNCVETAWKYMFANSVPKEAIGILLWAFLAWAYWVQRLTSVFNQMVFVVGYTANKLASHFVEKLGATPALSVDLVYQHFDNFKSIGDDLNICFSEIYFFLFVTTVCYYAILPVNIKKAKGNKLMYWYRIAYLIMHTLTWLLTSEYHRKIQVFFRKWISKRKLRGDLKDSEIGKLNLLAMENENDPVGISCRCFVVNYDLLTSIVGLLVTYVALTLQFS